MKIEDLIKKIEEDKFNEKQLINLYNNAFSKQEIDEAEKESLIEAIEKNTRLRFPRAAKRIFGAKESVASQKHESLYVKLASKYDFTRNRLKNGVKAGGRMISGEYYIDVYLSYKNFQNQGAAIALTQENIDAELEVTVKRYCTHNENSGEIKKRTDTMDAFESCANTYDEYLSEVIN
ncbi:TPA: hypothetical protein RQK39_003528 [Vibrio vulnificus]|uniref:hypothetical protein n=1 Tax=Vibrio vulnificus TaxID=672 RepID=UPI0007EE52A6|nr:hypothetical protein [Vibrio vulnificus]ANN28307.1 hypothetical protein FORC17_3244 [Vibrio vulnificus]HAS6216418.1 hypothetical protein [Vibrio vulnificus]HAS6331003.1 hypothetical protein [Vibrio vulnificus]HAS6373229.1 hypothetical protein [Vibrio vulnificus]HAS6382451.1 hypothetical protein [Vibrio vulnificus]